MFLKIIVWMNFRQDNQPLRTNYLNCKIGLRLSRQVNASVRAARGRWALLSND